MSQHVTTNWCEFSSLLSRFLGGLAWHFCKANQQQTFRPWLFTWFFFFRNLGWQLEVLLIVEVVFSILFVQLVTTYIVAEQRKRDAFLIPFHGQQMSTPIFYEDGVLQECSRHSVLWVRPPEVIVLFDAVDFRFCCWLDCWLLMTWSESSGRESEFRQRDQALRNLIVSAQVQAMHTRHQLLAGYNIFIICFDYISIWFYMYCKHLQAESEGC